MCGAIRHLGMPNLLRLVVSKVTAGKSKRADFAETEKKGGIEGQQGRGYPMPATKCGGCGAEAGQIRPRRSLALGQTLN